MHELLSQIKIKVNEHVYLKDPESSDLGKRILSGSIELIDKIGFEEFTFRKLGAQIGSNESSIYRYFENKHKLLVYLTAWYWGWLEYRLVFLTANISNAKERLKRAIALVTEPIEQDSNILHINEVLLNKIVICHAPKAYLTKEVDTENKEGYFSAYKRLVNRIGDMIEEVNTEFPHSHTLASTVIEGSQRQHYFYDHLPSLTDVSTQQHTVTTFYTDMVLNMIEK